ncbi:MAG: signal recognition particle-docking protein FtsY [Myxococcota bacterium]|nr:signal recognition particle-docking protein FtsY [Myxococcota bacterium]
MDPMLIGIVAGGVGAAALLVWLVWWRGKKASEEPEDVPVGDTSVEALSEPDSVAEEPEEAGGAIWRGLARTRQQFGSALGALFGGGALDESLFESLEEALISADVGVRVSRELTDALRDRARREGMETAEELRTTLAESLKALLKQRSSELLEGPPGVPRVILVVGVNGSGKTTTIGKLAARFGAEGQKVMLGAGDTFRAGAIDQLRVWADRAASDIVAHGEGADPAAVLFDALDAAKARSCDVVLCDTAGRLQSKGPLMEELAKVNRVVGKAVEGAPHEVLLVLDATIGQNAVSQARIFGEVTGVTGVVLTKLDGTARGGVVIAVAAELGLPVKFIGVGEKTEDLRPFDADSFVEAILAPPEA